jgi:hypothetical protein
MENGIYFKGNAAFPDVQLIRAAGQELRDLIDVAYGAHLNQVNMGKLIDAFTSKVLQGHAGVTDCSISGTTITSNDYLPPAPVVPEPQVPEESGDDW